VFSNQSARQWPKDTSKSKCSRDDGLILWPLSQWNHVRGDDESHGHQTSTTNALDRPAGEELREAIRGAADDCADREHEE
jgi:hypothetical protein